MAIDPLTGALITKGAGTVLGGVTDIIGSKMASGARRDAEKKAMADLNKGLTEAKGYQSGIYEPGIGVYQDLVGRYEGGEFQRPDFEYDPQDVFSDPEYQAAMRAGSSALGSSAEAKGDLFSTASQQAQQQFGQDLFSQRSDALFNRAAQVEDMARKADLMDYEMGMGLSAPAFNAADDLSNLAYSGGKDLADMRLQAGRGRSGDIMGMSNILGGAGKKLLGYGSDYLLGGGRSGGGRSNILGTGRTAMDVGVG